MKEFTCDNDCSRCRYGSAVIKVKCRKSNITCNGNCRRCYYFSETTSGYKCLLKSVSKSTLQEKFKFKTKFKI